MEHGLITPSRPAPPESASSRPGKTLVHSSCPLTNGRGESKYYQEALIGEGGFMVLCPECETNLDVDEEEVDEGEVISCPECGTDFEVVTTSPLELKALEAGYEEEDEAEAEESEDGDYS
jgi:alpha-aminoadipate carrier protein LysW